MGTSIDRAAEEHVAAKDAVHRSAEAVKTFDSQDLRRHAFNHLLRTYLDGVPVDYLDAAILGLSDGLGEVNVP